jgi:hypothetical protein
MAETDTALVGWGANALRRGVGGGNGGFGYMGSPAHLSGRPGA